MLKKIALTLILSVFVFFDFSCVVVTPHSDPPPPKRVRRGRPPGPNYIWVKGHWKWKSGTWRWVNGYWLKKKKGKVWVPGHWKKRGGRKVWVPGRWRKV